MSELRTSKSLDAGRVRRSEKLGGGGRTAGGTMTLCKRCGGQVVWKSRPRLALVGGLIAAGVGLGLVWAPLWAPGVVLGLTGAYLLTWASVGRGRWCRGCKRFDGV